MTYIDPNSLWLKLQQQGLADGELPAADYDSSPWYVRTMLGIAGWFGALFLLAFVGLAFSFVMDSAIIAGLLGAALCFVAATIFRKSQSQDFFRQFAFAISLAGQGLILFGLFEILSGQIKTLALILAVIQAVLFLYIDDFLHRVWSALIGISSVCFVLNAFGFYPYTLGLMTLALSWLWFNEFRFSQRLQQVHAIAYALCLICVGYLLVSINPLVGIFHWSYHNRAFQIGGLIAPWIGGGLIGLSLIWLVWNLLQREQIAHTRGIGLFALITAAAIALLSLKAPGIGVSMLILLLGFAHSNRVLIGLGIISLLAYISKYYYFMQITLLEKSILLIASGLLLLTLRIGLNHYQKKEIADA